MEFDQEKSIALVSTYNKRGILLEEILPVDFCKKILVLYNMLSYFFLETYEEIPR